jgi:PTH1 family peptidyl-tRNA hydrolase
LGLWGLFRREPEDARVVAGLKVVLGLGNPGPEYAATRHNAGWWLLDALAESWGLGRFKKEKESAVAAGRVDPFSVRLVKPLTYMNLSGRVLAPYRRMNAFDVRRDLLVVVDDVALPPGRIRFRPEGSAGGHNGLKSVEAALGTREYPRLRIGVGGAAAGSRPRPVGPLSRPGGGAPGRPRPLPRSRRGRLHLDEPGDRSGHEPLQRLTTASFPTAPTGAAPNHS